ncbi:MAG TPA: heme exporter protein CcmB [Steroidobacteraceae bacterium]|jgi:heme exporter protein B|nr:heme exporter protein CcmB [Steroidobacteraceae bacterium]
MSVTTSAWSAAGMIVLRDLRLAFRRPGEWLQPVAFFLIVTMLFPLSMDPEPARLRALAPGALWVAALLSSVLAIEFLFREDGRDGTLEQFALSGQSFAGLLLAKTAAHWLLTGLPLTLAAPLAAIALGAPAQSIPGVLAALLLGSLSLSLLGAIGAGLTLGLRRGGALLSLLVLPLAVPTLIFGARATELAITGEPLAAPLYLLAALVVFGLTLAPLAAAAAVRISLE